MTSAAQFLHDFFTAGAEAQNGRDFRPLFDAVSELEAELKALALTGGNVRSFLELLPRLKAELRDVSNADLTKIRTVMHSGTRGADLAAAELGLLDLAIERTAMESQMDTTRDESIRSLLAAIEKLVVQDESLDPQLRLFMARALQGVRIALDEYEITGEFKLRESLLTLFGLLRTAEATSEEPKQWKDAWDKYGVPASAGLIASLPQLALTSATLLAALGS